MKTVKTKRGAASLYVVIFTTLLLGIITLGFIRIMLSEAIQTSNADLSQSAYDSALAGVEDAKVALLKYHQCLSEGFDANASGSACEQAIAAMQATDSTTDCDIVRKALNRQAGDQHETIIQSTTGEDGVGSDMEQAYTCVLISENNPDYLGQLNSNYTSKLIPLRVDAEDLDDIEYISVSWYSDENVEAMDANIRSASSGVTIDTTNKPESYDSAKNLGLFPALENEANPYAPPTLGVQLIQTDSAFYLSEFDSNAGPNTNRGTLLLIPTTNSTAVTTVENSAATGFAAASDKALSLPTPIRCAANDVTDVTYKCTARLAVPQPRDTWNNGVVRNPASAFLRLFLPYGAPATDFSVQLLKSETDETGAPKDTPLILVGVQAKIDATGRANDLIRRVESRLELVDVYFPLPEYSAVIRDSSETLNKNFWVTYNNWGGNNSGLLSGLNPIDLD